MTCPLPRRFCIFALVFAACLPALAQTPQPPPQVSVGAAPAVVEGVAAKFTISLKTAAGAAAVAASPVTVYYQTSNGTATSPADYVLTTGSAVIATGRSSVAVNVPTVNDTVYEGNEVFSLLLTGATNAGLMSGGRSGSVTITDNDAIPAVAIENAPSVTERNPGQAAVNAVFNVRLARASAKTTTVDYRSADGTAKAGSDYAAVAGTLTFAAGTTLRTVAVPIVADLVSESTETFIVNLAAPQGATLGTTRATGTVVDNDVQPNIVISNAPAVTEPNSGQAAVNAVFSVKLSTASAQAVSVKYATASGTAKSGSDFTATSGTLTFAPGTTSKTIAVPVRGDNLDEAAETFNLNFSSPVGALLPVNKATASITDNDPAPALTVADAAAVAEPDSGQTDAAFVVSLSPASGQSVTVRYATASGSATNGSDFTSTSGTLTFAPGITTQTVNVPVRGDLLDEPNENFVLKLSAAVNATLTRTQASAIITDNDAAPTVGVANTAPVTEPVPGGAAASATFTIALNAPSAQTVTVAYATANGTALAGRDYTATSGTLTFAANERTKSVTVPLLADSEPEGNETFYLQLGAPVNATLAAASRGTATIADNGLPNVMLGDNWSWETFHDAGYAAEMDIGIAAIINRGSRTTGSLKVGVWAMGAPYSGGAVNGYGMGEFELNPLAPGARYNDLLETVFYFPPPSGARHTVLLLSEWDGTQWVLRDYLNANAATSFPDTGPVLGGTWSWDSGLDSSNRPVVTLGVDAVINTSARYGTGHLQLELWALPRPYSGGDAYGYLLAELPLSPLGAGAFYDSAEGTVAFDPPTGGTWHTALFLTEWTGSEFVIVDALNADGTTDFGGAFARSESKAGAAESKAGAAMTNRKALVSAGAASGFSTATASVASGLVQVSFTGGLDAVTANDIARYSVQLNGVAVGIESAMYNPAMRTVSLRVAGLATGDQVRVGWTGLRDSSGRVVAGSAGPIGAR